MAWLRFTNLSHKIELFPGTAVGARMCSSQAWSAHNDVASSAVGPWPVGTFKWSHYNAHQEAGYGPACLVTSYGCDGIHVFDVPGRTGMGVHAGRLNFKKPATPIGGKTMGCVRVVESAMNAINLMHVVDPLIAIVIE